MCQSIFFTLLSIIVIINANINLSKTNIINIEIPKYTGVDKLKELGFLSYIDYTINLSRYKSLLFECAIVKDLDDFIDLIESIKDLEVKLGDVKDNKELQKYIKNSIIRADAKLAYKDYDLYNYKFENDELYNLYNE